MPDKHGFNHLGAEVRCIEVDCDFGGPLYKFPEHVRRRHAGTHETEKRREAARATRRRAAEARRLANLASRENKQLGLA